MYRHAVSSLTFIAAFFLSGCISFNKYHDVTFQVIDAETAEPIPHATLTVAYDRMFAVNPPEPQEAVTSSDGLVTVRAANHRGEFHLAVTAENYIRPINHRAVIRSQPDYDKFRRVVLPDGVVNVVPMYSEPRPLGTLIVPRGFQGLIRYPRVSESDIVLIPGQREFTVAMHNDGVVHLPRSGVAAHMELEIRDSDNTLIPDGDSLSESVEPETARYRIGNSDYGYLEYVGDYFTGRAAYIFVNRVTFSEGGGSHSQIDVQRANQVWEQGLSAIPDLHR